MHLFLSFDIFFIFYEASRVSVDHLLSVFRFHENLQQSLRTFFQVSTARALCQWILEICKIYTTPMSGVEPVNFSKIPDNHPEAIEEKIFIGLISLLQHLCDNDVADDSSVAEVFSFSLSSIPSACGCLSSTCCLNDTNHAENKCAD